MYAGKEQVFTKKVTHHGIVREKINYTLYEHVDETEKYRRIKKYVEPPKQPTREQLDNYRYYEDLHIRRGSERKKSIVKHERLSRPTGKETPFLRDSFKTLKINAPQILRSASCDKFELASDIGYKLPDRIAKLKGQYHVKSPSKYHPLRTPMNKSNNDYFGGYNKNVCLAQDGQKYRGFKNGIKRCDSGSFSLRNSYNTVVFGSKKKKKEIILDGDYNTSTYFNTGTFRPKPSRGNFATYGSDDEEYSDINYKYKQRNMMKKYHMRDTKSSHKRRGEHSSSLKGKNNKNYYKKCGYK